MIEGIMVEGLIYGIMALGVFISFRVLDFPDLTVDGSFPLGAAVMAQLVVSGFNPWAAMPIAFLAGVAAGVVTALIHNKLKVPNLLAGILTMTMLYSINIRVLGNRANLPLLRQTTIVTAIRNIPGIPDAYALLIFFLLITTSMKLMLDLFFRTDLGLAMGAMGNNQQMVVSQGVNPQTLKIIGIGLSNGMVAVSGAFIVQYQGFADINLGQGIIIAGLASVMIGEFLLRSNQIMVLTLRVVLGSVVFRAIMYLGRYYGYYIRLTPNDLKLLTGLLIIASLILTNVRKLKGRGFQRTGRAAGQVNRPGVDGGETPR